MQPLALARLQIDMVVCVRARMADVLVLLSIYLQLLLLSWWHVCVPQRCSGVDAATALQVELLLLFTRAVLSDEHSVTFFMSRSGTGNDAIRLVQLMHTLLHLCLPCPSVGAVYVHQH
jgi:hypothetical protein